MSPEIAWKDYPPLLLVPNQEKATLAALLLASSSSHINTQCSQRAKSIKTLPYWTIKNSDNFLLNIENIINLQNRCKVQLKKI